jgi:HPt (histidine-containing phosphotransfer) domain-containing protein
MTLENLRRGGHEIPDHGDDAPVSPALDVGSDPVASPLEQWRRNEAAGGDGSFLEDLLGAFLASTPHVVEELRRALDHGDRDDVQRTAKALELSLDRVGATTARDLARELAEHEGNDQSAAKILASLDREVEVVTRKLGERMQG